MSFLCSRNSDINIIAGHFPAASTAVLPQFAQLHLRVLSVVGTHSGIQRDAKIRIRWGCCLSRLGVGANFFNGHLDLLSRSWWLGVRLVLQAPARPALSPLFLSTSAFAIHRFLNPAKFG